ncbi:DUF5602 domain-containing protein [Marinobacter zhejiangensis]|uniref:Uncharacterized protein n=1 Tax=Marinobacter zhejiangensis TaxID=488535 RepID=A0A1I4P2M5_9GAMM|nr:DUF5602 domain-containing protein [Marinobacter zhejiangensis]SFM21896.1 hypothetical protein SAMN04487963_1768 [Marinobacter zhejiangensis]
MNTVLCQLRITRSIHTLAFLALSGLASASEPSTFTGTPVAVGDGTAHVMVTTNDMNEPASVSVVLTKNALQGLPEIQGDQVAWEFTLPLPENGPNTGYQNVVLDWNPVGHPPEGVYSVPHFDVHFYLIGDEEREAITFQGEGNEPALSAPDPQLLPDGYVIPPDTAVDQMGVHALDPGGEEFQGQPFSHNIIYGYYKGQLIFIEPMLSLALLKSLPDITATVPRPERYSFPGWYPATYRIGFNVGSGEYTIALDNLQRFD